LVSRSWGGGSNKILYKFHPKHPEIFLNIISNILKKIGKDRGRSEKIKDTTRQKKSPEQSFKITRGYA
jgi:hypothetical protein